MSVQAEPRYRSLARTLRDGIASGEHPPGSELPSEHELAARHGLARGTVRQALASLRAEGAIAVRRGARPVVIGQPATQPFAEVVPFSAWVRSLGKVPMGRVVELSRREADEVDAERLAVARGAEVWRLVRVRLADGEPWMIERSLFEAGVGRRVAALDLEHASIYGSLLDQGVPFAYAHHTIDALAADGEDARLLDLPRHAPLLRQRRRVTSPEGRVLEWADDRYRSDVVAFTIHNAVAAPSLGRLHQGDRAPEDPVLVEPA